MSNAYFDRLTRMAGMALPAGDAAISSSVPGHRYVPGRQCDPRPAIAQALRITSAMVVGGLLPFLIGLSHLSHDGSFDGKRAGETRVICGVKLCWAPPGRFRMGSPLTEPQRRPDEGQIDVTLTHGFWIGKYAVTQADWKRMMGKLPGPLTEKGGEGDKLPVYNVNFAEAEAFCARFTERARKSGELPANWVFRLPTEAQREYACRAGTTRATAFGDRLGSKQANFSGKPYNCAEAGPSLGRATPVGSYPSNGWGLCDMQANVVEWCRDWYHARLPGGVDPDLHDSRSTATPNRDGSYSRVRRGGAWCDDGWACRSAFRQRFEPERRADHIGFRVVCVQGTTP